MVVIEGRRQSGRDQPQAARHRQHARRPLCRVAGAAGRRHRSRRRLRPDRRHDGPARTGGAGAGHGARDQQVSRRSVAADVRTASTRATHRSPGDRRAALLLRHSRPRRGFAGPAGRVGPTMSSRSWTWPSCGCPASPTSTTSIRCAASAASACDTSAAHASSVIRISFLIPGSKTTVDDLDWLRSQGLAERIVGAREAGTPRDWHLRRIPDARTGASRSRRRESSQPVTAGLGLLPTSTTFRSEKVDASGLGARGVPARTARGRARR